MKLKKIMKYSKPNESYIIEGEPDVVKVKHGGMTYRLEGAVIAIDKENGKIILSGHSLYWNPHNYRELKKSIETGTVLI